MKTLVKKVVISKSFKLLLKPIIWILSRYEIVFYNLSQEQEIEELVLQLSELQKLEVLNGPFKGMKYPEFLSLGSTLIPKLIGSYEAELHPIIDEIIACGYEEIWDVGCAEGYYAVGLALMSPTSKIRAYDIDIHSRKACLK